jgi:protein-tyrosine phosphatase
MPSVLFVCMGNICRSPTAHGVMQHLVNQAGLNEHIQVDSAGTHNYHPGEPPDERSQAHARKRGYDLSSQRARQVRLEDFGRFDLILAMDTDNLDRLNAHCPPELRHKLGLLTSHCTRHTSCVVPDPYYGGATGFEHVLDLVEDACESLLESIRSQQQASKP